MAEFTRVMEVTDSSQITQLQYDPKKLVLRVKFKNNTVYEYTGITRGEFGCLASNESVGVYFAGNIKPRYPGRKIDV